MDEERAPIDPDKAIHFDVVKEALFQYVERPGFGFIAVDVGPILSKNVVGLLRHGAATNGHVVTRITYIEDETRKPKLKLCLQTADIASDDRVVNQDLTPARYKSEWFGGEDWSCGSTITSSVVVTTDPLGHHGIMFYIRRPERVGEEAVLHAMPSWEGVQQIYVMFVSKDSRMIFAASEGVFMGVYLDRQEVARFRRMQYDRVFETPHCYVLVQHDFCGLDLTVKDQVHLAITTFDRVTGLVIQEIGIDYEASPTNYRGGLPPYVVMQHAPDLLVLSIIDVVLGPLDRDTYFCAVYPHVDGAIRVKPDGTVVDPGIKFISPRREAWCVHSV